jgi:hypothetical protein
MRMVLVDQCPCEIERKRGRNAGEMTGRTSRGKRGRRRELGMREDEGKEEDGKRMGNGEQQVVLS